MSAGSPSSASAGSIRSAVSAATWRRDADDRTSRGPGRRDAVIQAIVMALVGALLSFVLDRPTFAAVIWSLAAAVLVLGLVWPAGYRPVHGFGAWLGRVVGTVLVHVLLVPFFFLIVWPVAILLRVQGRDPLHRRMREARYTYWIARAPRERDDNISRQFLREDRHARSRLRDVATAAAGAPGHEADRDGTP